MRKKEANVLTGLIDMISPQALEFSGKQVVFNDQFARIMVIAGYPPKVNAAWLSKIAAMPGVVCSVHIEPTDPTNLILSLNKAIGEYAGRLEMGGNALTIQRTEQSLKDAEELMRKIDQEQQQVFYVTVVLMVLDNDQQSLDRKVRQVESTLAASGMRGRILVFRQEEGLKAVGPWCMLHDDVKDAGGRNMPAETVAASFPFTASGINDGSGVVLGKDRDGGLVLVDIWKRGGDRTNSNWIILAKPGAGKSFTAKMLLLREYMQGSRVIIIDPEREYKDMCKKLNGVWINCTGGEGRINPLQVRLRPVEEKETDESNSLKSPLALHIQTLRTFFSLYLRDLTDVEKAALEDALVEVYKKAGILWDTNPEDISNDTWPNIRELYEYCVKASENNPDAYGRLSVLLKRAAEGADSYLWAGPSTVEADSDFIVFDVHELQNAEDQVKRAQYFNVLSFAWNIIERDRKEKTILVVDEAWMLVDPQTPQAIAFLRDTSKRIRKYNGSLVVIIQNIIDSLAPEVQRYGQALLDNPTFKLLLAQGEKDLETISGLMNLSEAEHDLLANAKRGEGLFVAGTKKIHIKIEAAPYELQYLTGGGN
ncbi:type IV secretory pathway VirB4 components-like protein protein [Thermoanaerobacterium thermosaccharolyticum DSM 571]|uniref:Type IV secretory pathway VirB4 components-like protein protein n=1 Tax=Thermoanaerobacterium thermosaccharolyticum (strain ATCC 7956 / DSM 571 / NCIMB 9385 / NCA 3814 / NCTC 13789 / WDCM 00135 / 2032) TaxID=580327 RepID=D9TQQ0_THETC|nr:ATP-binding protein [Thermoanaerobacterium thermosaccharolyticum]ADL67876.1 type IV secretory pathway VirB4 components-like protein protein [Thermoanaerobacterium thermosaccharolyticum DSM 571]